MEILLLEDDAILAESLKEYLESEGYSVDAVVRGEEVFDLTFEKSYDLYIFDINVPDINGFEVLKELKGADDTTPTIYISALVDIASINSGFEAGAIDYLKKPFDPQELLIRIRHHLSKDIDENIKYADIVYSPKSGKVQKGDEIFYLAQLQKNIFDRLILNIGEIVSADELMEFMEHPSQNALRVSMSKLKKRLGIDIKNIRGQGYTIEKI